MTAAFESLAGLLGQTLYLLLLIGAAISVLIGILLFVDSARVLRWNGVLNGWFSTQGALAKLEAPRDIKRILYRGHRIAGVLVVAGALYALAELWWRYPGLALARAFGDLGSPELAPLIFESVRLFLILGNVAALAAGTVVFFRPSLLKPLEGWADRVYRPRITGEGADKMRLQADEFAKAHPRLLGLLTAAGGVYVLLNLSFFYNT
jgi:hypothetical protein